MIRRTALFALAALALGFVPAASAHEVIFTSPLTGAAEVPGNSSPATGFTTVTIDLDLFTMRLEANFSGLTGDVTAAHIHVSPTGPGSNGGVATQVPSFTGFPLGVRGGTYDRTFDMTQPTSWNPAYVNANGGTISTAFNAFYNAMLEGRNYLNIHTRAFPGGEIRGYLTPVPEPTTIASAVVGVLGFAGIVRSRRKVQA